MKLSQVIEFLTGFFGIGYLIWFFTMKDPKFDFGSVAGIAVFIFELVFLNCFMFLYAKNTKKFPGFFIQREPASHYYNLDSYFFKGIFVFSIVTVALLIFAALYYSIIPGLSWMLSAG